MNKTLLGILLAGTTGVLWGFTTLATRLIGSAGVSVVTAVLFRMVTVTVGVGTWLCLRHPDQLKIARRDAGLLFLFSFFGPFGLYLGFMLSIVYLNAATALVLHYTYPVLTVIFSSLVTGERPGHWDYLGACIVTLGVGCSVLTSEWTLDTHVSVPGLLCGVIAVIGLAGQSLLARATVTKGGMSRWAFFFYTHLFGMFWTVLYVTLRGQWGVFAEVTPYIAMLILVPTILGCFMGYAFYYKALEYVPASVGSLMTSLEILSGVTLTALFAGQPPTMPQVVGCVFIFIAIMTVSLSRLHRE